LRYLIQTTSQCWKPTLGKSLNTIACPLGVAELSCFIRATSRCWKPSLGVAKSSRKTVTFSLKSLALHRPCQADIPKQMNSIECVNRGQKSPLSSSKVARQTVLLSRIRVVRSKSRRLSTCTLLVRTPQRQCFCHVIPTASEMITPGDTKPMLDEEWPMESPEPDDALCAG
jgi:hypothetical protein